MSHRTLLISALVLFGVASAAELDERGWQPGTPAVNAALMMAPVQEDIRIDLPKDFVKTLKRPTLLVYFSPTCPHCIAVTPELRALQEAVADKADMVFIATGSSTPGQIAEYRATYGVGAPIVHDTERTFGPALGVRSTPSVALVEPTDASKTQVKVRDAWYPYVQGFDTLVRVRLSPEAPFAPFDKGAYHGLNTCGSCHVYEAQSWQLTHHSVAWLTLVKREEHANAACTGCHVTGAGQPGGWTPTTNADLVDVGCEACHGPGGPHDGETTDPRTTCAGCHDDKHSIAFTVDKGIPLIDHFAAQDMDEETFMARRKALYDGETPRELLAFGEGQNVGAEACKECHAAQHEAWSTSDHARAMGVLAKDDKHTEVDCVRCHATATASGPPPATLEGYRVDDGVGCESCHGPGEAHVAAKGGTGNIERLGDDCPVCVIEAVCTGCHTPKWDEDWNLDRDLLRVRGHGILPLELSPP